jgi:hypothetical protein
MMKVGMSLDSNEVLAKLMAQPAPFSWPKLKKAFVSKKTGVTEADLRSALEEAAIFAWPRNSYWYVDPTAQLHADILEQCTKRALKKTEIKVKGRGPKDISAALEGLVNERKLLKYPAISGTSVLLVTAGTPEAYWEYVREVVTAKLKKAGIEEAGLEEKIWDVLPKLEPEMNVPVSTSRVRRALGEVDKKRFDEAALKLREQRRVYLSQHDHPLGLSEDERDWLIDGKDGRYYVAITRRGE